ncbi:acetate--CoA ligase [Patescibacteria group bacterium]
MPSKIIPVSAKKLSRLPNLKNYDLNYQKFTYAQVKRELGWPTNGRINAAGFALDQNAQGNRKNKVALFWEGTEGVQKKFTFWDLQELSNRFANVLRHFEIKRGERVFFFLPRIPEVYYGFLGTLKTGAIAGTLFAAFGPQALFDRLDSSDARILVTTKELLPRVQEVWPDLKKLELVLLAGEAGSKGKVIGLNSLMAQASEGYQTKAMAAEDDAFMLYTSGTTGKPKGVVHAHRSILHEYASAKFVLDLHEDDVYWCTADPGWVTGIAYNILGSWANGASSLVYEGRFNPEKWYSLLQEYDVNVWYTAPTAIRMLAASGTELAKKYNLSALRHLASVGEPLNPAAVTWGQKAFGLPFHDNWWQTETGGILIANYPSLPIKPGSMGKPVPGIKAGIVTDQGKKLPPNQIGNLAIRPGWPSMMKKIWRRPKKYQSYFTNNWYLSGDLAYQDEDGYFWFVGRSDDVIKTAGERVGPFEVESALVNHPAVIEAGVIGKPDEMRGEIIKAFVVLKTDQKPSEGLKEKLKKYVKTHLAGHAYPREIDFVKLLPKTRSGKIVRRFLKSQELGLPVGDTSTLISY